MPNWIEVFRQGVLEKCGASCDTTRKLALAISTEIDELVTADSLFNAHKRHRERLNLKPSLMDYMNKSLASKPPKIKPEDIKFELTPQQHKALKKHKRFVITSALNNTPVDSATWEALKTYAEHNKAMLIVLPQRYKNPTSQGETNRIDRNAWWPSEITPYMTDELLQLHEHFWVMGHVRIQATATKPLSGLGPLSRGASACFGHAQLAMQMVPTPQRKLPKVMHTTGSVSVSNYSDTKAGIRGDFHHSLGALVVELDGPRFYIRSLVTDDDGGFYDLDKYYTGKGVEESTGVLALVTGDEHAIFNDPACRAATYTNKDSIVNVLKPGVLVRHDVLDGYSFGHHNRGDVVAQIAKHRSGTHLIETELQLTIDHIDETTPEGVKNLIVSSNHHDHLLQWLRETNPFDEPWNADCWIELWSMLKDTIAMGPGGAEHADPFALWCAPRLKSNTEFLPPDAGASIAGITIDMHGHAGANGSRGSINQFARVGTKSTVGHSHTPGIQWGCHQVGTSSFIKLDYNRGLSSWAQAHSAIHQNGKRQMIFVVDGFWRLK